jgi:hypothetical protein
MSTFIFKKWGKSELGLWSDVLLAQLMRPDSVKQNETGNKH